MEGYIIEFASRTGEFQFRQALKGLPATVGRALNNDFIVDDPHVAAGHLRLEALPDAPDTLLITDLGSRNGLFKNGKRVAQAYLGRGESVHFGHTTLRLRHVNEQVPPERIDMFASRIFSLPVALLLFALSIITTLADIPFSHMDELSAAQWLGGVLGFGGLIAAWAGTWSVLGRIFAGRSQFVAHLAITGWAYLCIAWGSILLAVAGFAFSWPPLAHADKLLIGIVSIWALHRHLSLTQLRWPRLNLALAIVLTAIPTVFVALNNWKNEHRLLDIDTLDSLYDPALRISGDQSLDQFMNQMPALRARADAQRHSGNADDEPAEDNSDDE